MPTTVEGLLVLVLFIAPGFVASLVKNRLLPFSTPSPFRETVRFRDGTGYYGLSGEVSVSPSDRQIYLVPASFPTATPSLYLFGSQGELIEDLTQLPGMEKGVWVRITAQVSAIEMSR